MTKDRFPQTMGVYSELSDEWIADRQRYAPKEAAELATRRGKGPIVDLGCGPGWDLPALGADSVGMDASIEMLLAASGAQPGYALANGRLENLPFGDQSLGGAWASKSYVHLPAPSVPKALAELHRVLELNAPVTIIVFGAPGKPTLDHYLQKTGKYRGRWYNRWDPDHFRDVMLGAGFEVDSVTTSDGNIYLDAHKVQSLPDTVAPDMVLLICGLNPSPASADARVGFARPGNRFWPAAIASGLVSVDRDPMHALACHGVGMTDIVKRTTRRADEVSRDEFREGMARLERLATWLKPQAICMVGLAGWRSAVNRKAQRGWQDRQLGGCPVYVMPSTSGLNAHDTVDSLTEHFRAAQGPI